MWYCEHYKECKRKNECIGKSGYKIEYLRPYIEIGKNYVIGNCKEKEVKIKDEFILQIEEVMNGNS